MDWNIFISVTVLGGMALYKALPKIMTMVDDAAKASEPVRKIPQKRNRYSPPRQFVNSKGEPWCGSMVFAPACYDVRKQVSK